MNIDHIAIWTNDPERLKVFYVRFFGCKASERYDNLKNQFSSYFLSFPSGARIEIMKRNDITETSDREKIGLAHFALCTGTSKDVDELTKRFEGEGIKILSYPRHTGDGYYESVILDPDNNKIELISCS